MDNSSVRSWKEQWDESLATGRATENLRSSDHNDEGILGRNIEHSQYNNIASSLFELGSILTYLDT
jgi:hypothetical protein